MFPKSLKKGYFLAQDLSFVGASAVFRYIDPYFQSYAASVDVIKHYCDEMAAKGVDGFDLVLYVYEQKEMESARQVAMIARERGMDVWECNRWQKQWRLDPVVPPELIAWQMDKSGNILPAMAEQRNHIYDWMNPAAVDWMLAVLDEKYWPYMSGVANGWMFGEAAPHSVWPEPNSRIMPWHLRVHSPYVFQKWKEYCAEQNVCWNGVQIDRFPVPRADMEKVAGDVVSKIFTGKAGEKLTIYIPDERPENLWSWVRYKDIPQGNAVWQHWEKFLCQLFHKSFIHRISERLNRKFADQKDWRGVLYFQHDTHILDYRDFQTDQMMTGSGDTWCQGRSACVDFRSLLDDREITAFITEHVRPITDYNRLAENPISVGMKIAEEHGRKRDYGFMLFYDQYNVDPITEDRRWEMIAKYRPPILAAYSVPMKLYSKGIRYQKDIADQFWRRLAEHKKSL